MVIDVAKRIMLFRLFCVFARNIATVLNNIFFDFLGPRPFANRRRWRQLRRYPPPLQILHDGDLVGNLRRLDSRCNNAFSQHLVSRLFRGLAAPRNADRLKKCFDQGVCRGLGRHRLLRLSLGPPRIAYLVFLDLAIVVRLTVRGLSILVFVLIFYDRAVFDRYESAGDSQLA